jgi:hypothetical protein
MHQLNNICRLCSNSSVNDAINSIIYGLSDDDKDGKSSKEEDDDYFIEDDTFLNDKADMDGMDEIDEALKSMLYVSPKSKSNMFLLDTDNECYEKKKDSTEYSKTHNNDGVNIDDAFGTALLDEDDNINPNYRKTLPRSGKSPSKSIDEIFQPKKREPRRSRNNVEIIPTFQTKKDFYDNLVKSNLRTFENNIKF